MKMPMPEDLKQLRSLLGGLFYKTKFLRDMAKRIRPITSPFKQGVGFVFTPAMETIVRELLAELSTPSVLAHPNWDAVMRWFANKTPLLSLVRSTAIQRSPTHPNNSLSTPSVAGMDLRRRCYHSPGRQIRHRRQGSLEAVAQQDGSFQDLAVGPSPSDSTPDGRPEPA